jgi:SCY1-like protein 1
VKVLDTVETDTYIYIATERLSPLSWHVKRKSLTEETTKWGLHNIAKTLKFVNADAASIHGYIRPASIFFSESGEWKLGGFDALSSVKEDDSILPTYGGLIPDAGRYMAPEVSKGGWEVIKPESHPCRRCIQFRNIDLRGIQWKLQQQRSIRSDEEHTGHHASVV